MTTVFSIVICIKILCYFVVFFTTTRPWFFDFWYKMYQNSTFRCIFNNKNARITYLSISPFQKSKISRFKKNEVMKTRIFTIVIIFHFLMHIPKFIYAFRPPTRNSFKREKTFCVHILKNSQNQKHASRQFRATNHKHS